MNELVSTHGYSQNQIMVWKYPTMAKVLNFSAIWDPFLSLLFVLNSINFIIGPLQVATLTGHSLRVLYLAMSPDGQVLWIFH